ncbi:MAG: BON domain-containing protein [Planctomycetota bacterium]
MSSTRLPKIPALALLLATALVATPAAQEPEGHEQGPDDASITDAVENELTFDHAVPGYRITVETEDGVVSLGGSVESVLVRDRAAAIARTVRGVGRVINAIVVDPKDDITAADLRKAVNDALQADPATDSFEVSVQADEAGKVTLAGTVESWSERSLCGRVAGSVNGVTMVDNDLAVTYRMDRSDAEISKEIREVLTWDTLVDPGLIELGVEDGVVHLSGIVGSAAEKDRARADAYVAGVKQVEDADLVVSRWTRADGMVVKEAAFRDDDEIRDAVQRGFLRDPRLSAFRILTTVDDGRVTLRGSVDNLMAKRAATRLVWNTNGAQRVNNRLRIDPLVEYSDDRLAAMVAGALGRSPFVVAEGLDVDVSAGAVRLTGHVDSSFERGKAEEVVSRVNGVRHVTNSLQVDEPSLVTFDPYVDPWPIHDYPWYHYAPVTTFGTDEEIQDDITYELWWSPYVDSNEVHVEVENGVAILTGTVDSWLERASATENAFEGGATWVRNELEIDRNPPEDSE